MDDAEPLGVLHNLYLMTFTVSGRQAVVTVFTMAEHIRAVLPFIQFSDDKDSNTRVKRSVCHSYTVMLLLLIVRETKDITFLQRFAPPLLAFTDQGFSLDKLKHGGYR